MKTLDVRNLIIAALATVLILGLWAREPEPVQAGGSTDSNADIVAVTGEYGNGTTILWVIDTKARQLAAYRSMNGSTIELVGARKINWDLKLQSYRDRSPESYSPAALERQYLDYEAGRARSASPAGAGPEKEMEEKEK